MDEQLRLGASAVFLGFVAGTVMLVPFVAASYRRHGSFPIGRALTWAAALTYGWGIWTYTLLPLPDPATLQCADVNTDLFAFTRDIDNAWSDAAGVLSHYWQTPRSCSWLSTSCCSSPSASSCARSADEGWSPRVL
ncbi:hypothetical protein [Rhodococcus sp. SJ-2]